MNDWIKEAIFYHIYPLGFCGAPLKNEENAPCRRLDKLAEWIGHLKELGVNALYLGPVFESSSHGYDTRDYYQIDRRLGDRQSFAALCDKLHQAGIRIILDGVFNHVGREFAPFVHVREHGADSPYCSWFTNLNFGGPSPLGDPFWYEGWQGHYELVKLNLRHPELVAHLLGAVKQWIELYHIDGLRLDAADQIDMDFFRQLRRYTDDLAPGFWLMGEIIHGDYSRWACPGMLDSVTNYECYKGLWSAHNSKNYFEIAHSLNRQYGPEGIYRGIDLYNFADNHDVNRLASTLTHPVHAANVYTILYTMPGVPSLYYGSEWGLEGARSATSDTALRPCLDLAQMDGKGEALCAHLKMLAKIRQALPALRYGDFENIVIRNEQLVFRRALAEQCVYVALNLAETESLVEFSPGQGMLSDILHDNAPFYPQDGHVHLTLPACSARILANTPAEITR